MLLHMNELTDEGGDMKLFDISGELQALHQALWWFVSIQDEEFNVLTSIVILSDSLWALKALTNRQQVRSHKKFVAVTCSV